MYPTNDLAASHPITFGNYGYRPYNEKISIDYFAYISRRKKSVFEKKVFTINLTLFIPSLHSPKLKKAKHREKMHIIPLLSPNVQYSSVPLINLIK